MIGAMFDLQAYDRGRILLYLLIGVVVLVVGLSAIRSRGVESEKVVAEAGAGPGLVPRKAVPALVIDVSGAVRKPGVYRLEAGSRVIDAIRRAGGPTDRAYPSGLNRAALLVDGQQVVLPEKAPGTAMATTGSGPGSGSTQPVPLGMATVADLDQIEGIGPVTAGKIIEFRDSRGGLSSVDDLDRIPGIGPATMETLRSAIQP